MKSYTSLKHSEIPWADAGCQAALEGTCQEKPRRSWTKIEESVLARGRKIGPVDTQQPDAVQTNIESCVDLRLTAERMHETEQH